MEEYHPISTNTAIECSTILNVLAYSFKKELSISTAKTTKNYRHGCVV
jgi:hypothetical protein